MIWVAGLAGTAAVGLLGAYALVPHVRARISRFMDPSSGDNYQVGNAIESFIRGGWFGQGPGEGTVKRILPDSHADFVFAVAAEEFGIVLCLALVALFAFVVIRALQHAFRDEDPFTRFATAGLAILFGTQSAINMAVNLHLIPAKGMTLPFISYGGSSMISLAYGMGMLLALTRERPRVVMPGTFSGRLVSMGAAPRSMSGSLDTRITSPAAAHCGHPSPVFSSKKRKAAEKEIPAYPRLKMPVDA